MVFRILFFLIFIIPSLNTYCQTVQEDIPVRVPNVFTPNKDNINDLFRITGTITELDVQIYNRWGEKIYEWKGTGGSWDGYTPAGVEVPDGVYYYTLKYKLRDNQEIKNAGILQLMR